MPHKIHFATVSRHISAVLYLLIGLAMFPLVDAVGDPDYGREFAWAMLAFCLVLIVGIEIVVAGLHRRRYWAWIAGICIFGMYASSLFLPLGAFGLWGLLDGRSRAEFGMDDRSKTRD